MDHFLEGGVDSIEPLLLNFLGAAIFCMVVQFLEDGRLFVHVGGKLTESLSVVDLWFLVGGDDGVDKRLMDLLGPSNDDGVDGWGCQFNIICKLPCAPTRAN